MESPDENLRSTLSIHQTKKKTKRKKTKVVLGNKKIYPRQRRQKVLLPFHTPGSHGRNLQGFYEKSAYSIFP